MTEGTAQDAARFEDVLNKLASYVGTQPWSRSSVAAKAMGELLDPVFTEPTKPVRRYNVHLERNAVVPIPRDQTTQRMHTNQGTMRKVKLTEGTTQDAA